MALGLIFPGVFIPVKDRVMLILGSVMTLTFLTLDFRDLLHNLKRFHVLGLVLLVSKGILPFLFYLAAGPLGPDISLAVLLLCLTPFAAVSPTLTKILGGDAEFVLVNQVLQTLLAPLYMPFLLLLFAGTEIELDVPGMMKSLVLLIIVPLAASALIKPVFRRTVEYGKKYFGALNIILISTLLTGLLASASAPIRENPADALYTGVWVIALGVFLPVVSWLIFFFLDEKKRAGLSIAGLYMNIGLTAVIAAGFFSREVLLFILLFELPANIFPFVMGKLGPFRKL